MKTNSDLVRACFAAYETKDRQAIETLLADDFTFTSPLDDNISRERYFERCWPNSEHITTVEIEHLMADEDKVFVQYQIQPADGKASFRNAELFTLRDGQITHVDVFFGAETAEDAAEEEILTVITAWAEAIRKKDVEGVLKCFANETVRFYLAPPLLTTVSMRQNLEEWFATFEGDLGYELRDLAITTSGDLAYSTSLNHLTGVKTDGEKSDVWFRETLCLRKIAERWLIVHEHESVPFYMDGSYKAAVDLKP